MYPLTAEEEKDTAKEKKEKINNCTNLESIFTLATLIIPYAHTVLPYI